MAVVIRKKLEKAASAKGLNSIVRVYARDSENWTASVSLYDQQDVCVEAFYSNGFVLTKKDAMYWVPRLVDDAMDAVEAMDPI
tara:strand:+ start:4934 stop:5182 length:249 start_codon:yes stop_codon:yes gene_type:complete